MSLKTVYKLGSEAQLLIPTLSLSDDVPEKIVSFFLVLNKEVEEKGFCDKEQLIQALKGAGLNGSLNIVNKRMKLLSDLNILETEPTYINGRLFSVTTISSFRKLINHYISNKSKPQRKIGAPRKELISKERQALDKNHTEMVLKGNTNATARIESLFCIFDAAMKLNGRDKRKKIECEYKFHMGDSVLIKALTLTDDKSDIAYLSDQRVMRAINGSILDDLEERFGSIANLSIKDLGIVDEYFYFDLHDLCRRIGLRPNILNRSIVREMIERLRDTHFEIDATYSAHFRNNFSLGAEVSTYSYITEFFAKRGPGDEQTQGSDRFYVLKLHTAILHNLISTGRSFISHPELAREKSGIAHIINNWNKSYIGVRDKKNIRDFTYVMDELRDKIMPSARLFNFNRDFLALMQRQSKRNIGEDGSPIHKEAGVEWDGSEGATNTVWLYGYYFKIEWDQARVLELNRMRYRRSSKNKNLPVITIWRDVEDPYVGNNSDHAQALRREAQLVNAG